MSIEQPDAETSRRLFDEVNSFYWKTVCCVASTFSTSSHRIIAKAYDSSHPPEPGWDDDPTLLCEALSSPLSVLMPLTLSDECSGAC